MSAPRSSDSGLSGLFYDGQRSKGYPARLRREGEHLLIEYGESERLSLALDDVRVGTQVGQANCYLHLPAGAVFESTQREALTILLAGHRGARRSTWLQRLESSYRLILASAVVVVLSVGGMLVYGVPWVAKQIASAVPSELEAFMGQRSLAAIERFWLEPSALSPERQKAVQDAFAPHLLAFAERYPGQTIEVRLFASEAIGANALALPGGIVIFTDGMLELAEDDNELVAVLAHEVGHVVHRHGLRNAIQSSMVLWAIMTMTGDLSAASDLLVSGPALLASLGYSRRMERDADDFALDYLHAAGLSPAHFAHIMQRLDPPDEEARNARLKVPEVLSSHPPTPERIRRFLEQP